jgi:hypothetical protein
MVQVATADVSLFPGRDACARMQRQPICRILGERRIGRQR